MPLDLATIDHELRESPIRKIALLLSGQKHAKDIISFGGGAPSLPPPKEVVNSLITALRKDPKGTMSYTATNGNLSLREKIYGDLKKHEHVSINPKQVAITTGATGAIDLALESLINPGDEIILADPTYAGYPGPGIKERARIKYVPTKWQDNFEINADALRSQITRKTKAFILLSPDNPTGRVLSKESIKAICDLAKDKDFWIITDETYKDILYEGRHWPAYNFAPDNTLSIFTYSKSASSPALRLGYVYGPEAAIDGIVKLNQFVTLCPSNISQIGAEAFYAVKKKYLRTKVLPIYKKRMEAMGRALSEYLPLAGYVKPQGAFYYFVDFTLYLRDLKISEVKFAERLLKEKHVVVIPGRFFGKSGENHCRLTFVAETEERIAEGIKRIADFFV